MQDLIEMIYRESYASVYKKVCKYTNGDWYLLEDAIHFAFEQLWNVMQQGKEIGNYEAWLITVGKHYVFNYQKKQGREELGEGFIEYVTQTAALASPEEVYLEQVQACEAISFAQAMLEGLRMKNYDWYEAVYHSLWLGKSMVQVAKELQMNSEALRSKIRRATEWMKREYRNQYYEILEPPSYGLNLKEAGTQQGPASSCLCQNVTKQNLSKIQHKSNKLKSD